MRFEYMVRVGSNNPKRQGSTWKKLKEVVAIPVACHLA
jgi:hypothetical protein